MGRMSKIRAEVDAKDDTQTTSTSRSTSNAQMTLQDKDDLKDEVQRRPQHRHTQNHNTNSSNSRPFLEKNDFLVKFSIRGFGFVESFPYICNTERHSTSSFVTHPSTQTIECFSSNEIFIKQRASSK